jgi:urea transport system substrate-binding protein
MTLSDARARWGIRGVACAALLVAAAVAVGCGGSDSTATGAGNASGDASATPKAPIAVGSILEETGATAAYGVPMAAATRLAIDDINAHGGVLGRKLKLDARDSKSDIAEYRLAAKELAGDPDVAVVEGGITSASREAIRPIFDAAKKLYFYNVLYEGGVCDKNTFVTGETPTQQLEPLLKWAADKGLRKWYVLAANYNYGQISAKWAKKLAKQYGAQIVGGPTFFDLTVSNFTEQIPKIQNSGADLIVSFLVGPGHLNFYKQWAATGLNWKTTIVSPSYGFGSEQVALGKDGKDIRTAYSYFQQLDTPESKAFLAKWKEAGNKETVTPGAITTWNGWHLWAEAVKKAGSLERDKVIAALEQGVSYDGPAGTVSIKGGSHHTVMPMRLWRGDGKGGFEMEDELSGAAPPTYEQETCDLVANPETNKQFTP